MVSLIELTAQQAYAYYKTLPLQNQIATLSPQYVEVDSMRDPTLKPIFLMYREGDNIWLLGAHKIHVPNSEYFALSSPYPYGGPNANTNDLDFLSRAWATYQVWCKDHMVLAEVFKLHPMLKHPYYGECKKDRLVYTCGLQYDQKCRNMVNKAKRNNLRIIELDRSIIPLHFAVDYRKAMIDMGASEFYMFNDEYFEALSHMPEACLLIAEDEFERWNTASIFLIGEKVMEYHLSITNSSGRAVGSNNMLIDAAQDWLTPDANLYLGGGRTKTADDSLAKFKASFGGKPLPFNIGWQIHRPDVYNEMRGDNKSERILWWK